MNAKPNYQKELDKVILNLNGRRPTLLLHSCCAPCSSYVLEYLAEYFQIILFYYNPNISPESEYRYRIAELRRLVEEMALDTKVQIIEGEYDPNVFLDAIKGMELEPEGGERCKVCYRLRLERAVRMAQELGCEYVTTTLSISPMKNADALNQIGGELADGCGVKYLYSDFKKRNGYKRSIELSAQYHLYRQDYCGCSFSKAERERKKKEREPDKD